jgi:hypothetical protein
LIRPRASTTLTTGAIKLTHNSNEATVLIYARSAGVLYLIIIACGIFSEAVIRSSLIVAGDASATAANILSSKASFRIGFAADAIMLLSDVAIAVLLYQLLKPVSKTLSLMAATFRLTQAAVLSFNLLNYYAPMLLLTKGGYMAPFSTEQIHALSMFFLELHGYGYDLGLLFFGLSNLVLGYLIIRADYFPGILGYGLQAAGLVYLAGSFTRFLTPEHASLMQPAYIVPLVAELSFALCLLLKGIRVQPTIA